MWSAKYKRKKNRTVLYVYVYEKVLIGEWVCDYGFPMGAEKLD